jgi:hypothetical protein
MMVFQKLSRLLRSVYYFTIYYAAQYPLPNEEQGPLVLRLL